MAKGKVVVGGNAEARLANAIDWEAFAEMEAPEKDSERGKAKQRKFGGLVADVPEFGYVELCRRIRENAKAGKPTFLYRGREIREAATKLASLSQGIAKAIRQGKGGQQVPDDVAFAPGSFSIQELPKGTLMRRGDGKEVPLPADALRITALVAE